MQPDAASELARLLLPDTPELHAAARAIHASREDLRRAYSDPAGAGYANWLAVNGLLEYPAQISPHFPPLPPEALRETTCGGHGEHRFLYSGAEDFLTIVRLWGLYSDRPFREIGTLLDFGCGCGRITRHAGVALGRTAIVGADVRAASIAWCIEHLGGRYLVNRPRPPLELPDGSVDLVVALSVFSHLNRESNLAWIRELARICRPDGRIILSTHGAFALYLLTLSVEHRSALEIPEAQARDWIRRLPHERFLYHRASRRLVTLADGVEENYGQAFFSERSVTEDWRSHVTLLGFFPAALQLLQDLYVLRPA